MADDILNIVGFYDANEAIAENSECLTAFLSGDWETSSGNTWCTIDGDDEEHQFECNFSDYPSGDYYFLNDAIYSVGDEEDEATNYLKFTILDRDTISVYCYINHESYIMYRQ